MNKIIAIGGEPATGKTTLMQRIIERHGPFVPCKYGTLRMLWSEATGVAILGVYGNGIFGGTDRLSMSVITHTRAFLKAPTLPVRTLLFEGDRLFHLKFLADCEAVAVTDVVILTASEEAKKERHFLRGDTQTPTWLKSRKTKAANLLTALPTATILRNENQLDADAILAHIEGLMTPWLDPLRVADVQNASQPNGIASHSPK